MAGKRIHTALDLQGNPITGLPTPAVGSSNSQAAPTAFVAAALASLTATLPLYSSDGTFVSVGPSSTARATMLPPALAGTSRVVKAGQLKPGSSLFLSGSGVVSASMLVNGNFTVTPTLGGQDLTATTIGIGIGSAAACIIWLELKQLAAGVMVKGYVLYGLQNATPMMFYLNPAGSIVASDYTIDRAFGVDAKWSISDASNYVTSHAVSAWLFRPIP